MSALYMILNNTHDARATEDPLRVTVEDVKPLVACRGCLATEQPLQLLEDQLADAFSTFIAAVEEHDIYPKFICMYCSNSLRSFVSFRNKCLEFQSELTKIASMGIPLTLDIIKSYYTSYPLAVTKSELMSMGFELPPTFMQNITENPSNPTPTILQTNVPDKSLTHINNDELPPTFMQHIAESPSDTIPTILQKNKPYDSIINKEIELEITPEPYVEAISDTDNDDNAIDEEDTDCTNDKELNFYEIVNDVKVWIDKVKSELPKKSNGGNAGHPSVSNFNAIMDHDYLKPTQEPIQEQTQDKKEAVKGSSMNDDETDCLISEIRDWIGTVKAKREEQNKSLLVISPGHSLLSLPKSADAHKSQPSNTARWNPKIILDNIEFEKKFNVKIVEISKDQQIQQINLRKDTIKYKNMQYKCDLCFTGFLSNITYQNHMAKHKPLQGHVMCDVCKKYYPKNNLTGHLQYHTTDYICNRCGHISKSRMFATTHHRWHEGIKYDCKICGKLFDKPNSVHGHIHLSHKDVMVKCSICSHQCIGDKGLHSHMLLSHKEAKGAVCPSCGVQFHSVSAMQRHRPHSDCDHTHRPCTACGEGFSSDVLFKQHQSQCKILQGVNYRCKMDRLRSIKVRTRDVTFVCEMCGCIKNSANQLDAHRRRKHTGETNYNCDHCGKGYFAKQPLQYHILTKHMGVHPPVKRRNYYCKYCNKHFLHPHNKSRHENSVHGGGVRRFACNICGIAFQEKSYVQQHIRHTHERVPWPKRVRNRRQ